MPYLVPFPDLPEWFPVQEIAQTLTHAGSVNTNSLLPFFSSDTLTLEGVGDAVVQEALDVDPEDTNTNMEANPEPDNVEENPVEAPQTPDPGHLNHIPNDDHLDPGTAITRESLQAADALIRSAFRDLLPDPLQTGYTQALLLPQHLPLRRPLSSALARPEVVLALRRYGLRLDLQWYLCHIACTPEDLAQIYPHLIVTSSSFRDLSLVLARHQVDHTVKLLQTGFMQKRVLKHGPQFIDWLGRTFSTHGSRIACAVPRPVLARLVRGRGSQFGDTLLHLALQSRSILALDRLLQIPELDVTVADDLGRTVFALAEFELFLNDADAGQFLVFVLMEYALVSNALPIFDELQRTPFAHRLVRLYSVQFRFTLLHMALKLNRIEVVMRLLHFPSLDPMQEDIYKRNALYYVTAEQASLIAPAIADLDPVQIASIIGAAVVADNHAFIKAAMGQNYIHDVVHVLDSRGYTILHYGAIHRRMRIFCILDGLPNLNFQVRDRIGMTPAQYGQCTTREFVASFIWDMRLNPSFMLRHLRITIPGGWKALLWLIFSVIWRLVQVQFVSLRSKIRLRSASRSVH